MLIAHFFGFVYGLIILRKEYCNLRFLKWKQLLENFKLLFSLGFIKQIGSIAQTFSYRISFYFLAIYCSKSIVGIYSNACSIGEAVMLFGTSLALVQYSTLSNTKQQDVGMNLTLKLTRANAIFTFLALLVLCLLPAKFWVFAFGDGFEDVGTMLRLLAVGIMLLSCSSNFTQYFASKGNFIISASASVVGFAITLILSFCLIPEYGINGAAITACISYSITFLIELIYFLKWKKERR